MVIYIYIELWTFAMGRLGIGISMWISVSHRFCLQSSLLYYKQLPDIRTQNQLLYSAARNCLPYHVHRELFSNPNEMTG